jgi:carboxylesterase type B
LSRAAQASNCAYYFSRVPPGQNRAEGAFHGSEIAYVIDNPVGRAVRGRRQRAGNGSRRIVPETGILIGGGRVKGCLRRIDIIFL